MEITKKARFISDFYGSAPAEGNEEVVKQHIDRLQSNLLSKFEKDIKKGQSAIELLTQILSVCHRDVKERPVLGSWQLKRCLIVTGQTIFNAMKDKTHPKQKQINFAIRQVQPYTMQFSRNGSCIERPDGIRVHTISKGNRSFFKAYEYISAGATFEFTINIDEELLILEHVELLLKKAGLIGVGAFRERFGKFEVL